MGLLIGDNGFDDKLWNNHLALFVGEDVLLTTLTPKFVTDVSLRLYIRIMSTQVICSFLFNVKFQGFENIEPYTHYNFLSRKMSKDPMEYDMKVFMIL